VLGFRDAGLAGFKSAVDYWFSKMTADAKREAVEYAIGKSKENLS
jgi:hypothetical protein